MFIRYFKVLDNLFYSCRYKNLECFIKRHIDPTLGKYCFLFIMILLFHSGFWFISVIFGTLVLHFNWFYMINCVIIKNIVVRGIDTTPPEPYSTIIGISITTTKITASS